MTAPEATSNTNFMALMKERTAQPAFFENGCSLLWGDALEQIQLIQHGLSHLGLLPGDTLLVCLPPSTDLCLLLFAIEQLGACALVLPTPGHRDELLPWSDAAQTVGAVLPYNTVLTINTDLQQRPNHRFGIIHGNSSLPGWHSWDSLLSQKNTPQRQPNTDTPWLLSTSTGTLTAPRAMFYQRPQLLAAANSFAKQLQQQNILTPKLLQCLPWSTAMWTLSLATLLAGGQLAFANTPSHTPSHDFSPEFISITPHQLMLTEPQNTPNSLKGIFTLGDAPPWDHPLAQQLPLHSLYSIEACCGPVAWANAPHEGAGTLLDGFELKIRRSRQDPKNTPGELSLKGPAICQKALDIEGRPSELLNQDGWFDTRDIGYTNEQKHLLLNHSTPFLFEEGNKRFSSTEVEDQLCKHPQIRYAALYRMSSPPHAMKACIEPDPHASGRQLTTQSVLEYLREHLPHYKLPKFIEFREEIPRNAHGKIAYWRLK